MGEKDSGEAELLNAPWSLGLNDRRGLFRSFPWTQRCSWLESCKELPSMCQALNHIIPFRTENGLGRKQSGTRIQTRRGQGKRTTEGPPASERGPRVPSGLMVASPLTAGSSGATHSTPTRTVLHPSTLFGDGFCRRWQSLPLECIWFYEDLSCPSGKTKIRAGYHNRKA